MRIIKLIGGEKFRISESEAVEIAMAKSQFIALRSQDVAINKNSISAIYPEEMDVSEQTYGVLRDGTLVRKHFGEWVLAHRGPDGENIRPDPNHYPELKKGRIATEAQYERVARGDCDYDEIIKGSETPKLYGVL